MGFMAGVMRLLGAEHEEQDDMEQIVEYPMPQRRSTESEPQQRVLTMPGMGDGSTMSIFRPQMEGAGQPSFSMRGYAQHLLSRQAVIVDVNDLATADLDEATRIIDYLSGVCEAVSGSVFEISKNIFIFAPSNINLNGDPLKQVEVY